MLRHMVHCALAMGIIWGLSGGAVPLAEAKAPWQEAQAKAEQLDLDGLSEKAVALYQATLREYESKDAETEPKSEFLSMYISLAYLLEQMGRPAEAIQVYDRGIAFAEKHQLTEGIGLMQMASDTYGDLGDKANQIAYWERSLVWEESEMGAAHHTVGNDQKRLARLYKEDNQWEKYEALLKKMILVRQGLQDANRISVVGPLIDLAELYSQRQDTVLARQYYEEAIKAIHKAKEDYPDDIRTEMILPYEATVQEALAKLP